MDWAGTLVALLLLAVAWIAGSALLASFIRRVTVRDFERGLLAVHGHYRRVLGAGVHWYSPRTSTVELVDMRMVTETVEGQEVLTLDGVSLRISLVAEYVIADPLLTRTVALQPERALYLTLQVAVRELISASNVDDLLAQREKIGTEVHARSAERVAAFGYGLISVNVRDIMFPGPLKRIMGLAVEARKEAEAALERARGEAATLRSLANTARLLEKNSSLLTLRTLQVLESGTNTVVLNLAGGGSDRLCALPLSTAAE